MKSDYGIVLEGELILILSDGEVIPRAGDVVVQRGAVRLAIVTSGTGALDQLRARRRGRGGAV